MDSEVKLRLNLVDESLLTAVKCDMEVACRKREGKLMGWGEVRSDVKKVGKLQIDLRR